MIFFFFFLHILQPYLRPASAQAHTCKHTIHVLNTLNLHYTVTQAHMRQYQNT